MGFPDGTWQAAVGGVVLGTSATVMLATTGKLIGLSGIFDGALSRAENRGWKAVFLSGLTAGGVIAGILYPEGLDQTGAPPISTVGLIVSGFLVGLGTRLGNGCTSGHGLCGLPRLSRRSLVATLTFLSSGVATASIMAAWASMDNSGTGAALQESPILALRYLALTLTSAAAAFTFTKREERESWKAHLASFLCGGTFGGGLVLSGMVKRAKVVDFLALRRNSWDPSLAFVLGFGVTTAFVGFPYVTRKLGAPACTRADVKGSESDPKAATTPFGRKFEIPTNTVVDLPLVLGAWLFGVGWGSSGMCPGPAFVAATFGLTGPALFFLPSVVVGMKVAGPLKSSMSLPDPSWVTGGGADKKNE